jgi:predicted dehydrogenase
MLAEGDIDIVDICTPHPFHAQQTIAAAKAGKHLIIEKPLCLTWKEAKGMRDAVHKAKVQACVCFEVRFSAHFQLTKSVIDQRLLGDIH